MNQNAPLMFRVLTASNNLDELTEACMYEIISFIIIVVFHLETDYSTNQHLYRGKIKSKIIIPCG